MNRDDALRLLTEEPIKIGHAVGFTKLIKMHNDWIRDMMFCKSDTTLQAHRESYKTTCLSIAIACLMVLVPNKRILFVRKSDDAVKEIIEQIRKILTSDEMRYVAQAIYGIDLTLKTSNAFALSTNLVTDKRGSEQLLGCGIGGSMTGKHFDYIFTDDIITTKDRYSRPEREHTKHVYQELQNLIIRDNGGRIYNTGTPWHKDDAFSIMPKPRKFDVYTTGLFDAERIAETKRKQTSSLFAANYELKHIASEAVIFDNPKCGYPLRMAMQGRSHIDAAFTPNGDWTAFTVINKVEGKYYVLGKCWQRPILECLDEIIKIRKQMLATRISCERNGANLLLAQTFRNKGENVYRYTERMNKHQKIVTYLRFEWDNVFFVEGTDEEYITQICEYSEVAAHDDCPDSLATLIREMRNA